MQPSYAFPCILCILCRHKIVAFYAEDATIICYSFSFASIGDEKGIDGIGIDAIISFQRK
jgi:hypothetical protein